MSFSARTEMSDTFLDRTIAEIRPADSHWARRAARALDDKTKPQGSLGRLEEVGIRLAGIHGTLEIATEPRAVAVMAADHGVVRQGVSAFPAEVTVQMLRNFASGGAAVNVLAREMRARTRIVDVGVAADVEWPAEIRRAKVALGTADMSVGPAMSEFEARAAVEVGIEVARELVRDGARVIATGDMGIGNSTAAAALTAVFTGEPASAVTGRGTGVDDTALERKIATIVRALEVNRPDPAKPLAALAAVGGLEIAAITGLVLGGAAARVPVVLDGYIAGSAALVAVALAPRASDFLFAGHRSAERGHRAALAKLDLEPLLDLGMRLGEGTGALLALPILDAAARILREMASFESAGVSRRSE